MVRQPEAREIPEHVQSQVDALKKEFVAVELELMKETLRREQPLLAKRDSMVASIDAFWPQALTNCISTNVYIDDDDHALLDHLTKLVVTRKPEDPRSARIEMHFSPNEHISDEVLVKEFAPRPDAGEITGEFDFVADTVPRKTTIHWKSDDKNLAKLKPTTGGEDEADPDFEPGSFFSSFFESDSPLVAGSIGRAIVDDLYPSAIEHFKGEGGDPDLDEEEEDEEEDEDDADREIDLEEEEEHPRKKGRSK